MALYAFDGTWNVQDRKGIIETVQSPWYGEDRSSRRGTVETNVYRFREFYGAERTEYLQGVGTRFFWVGRLVGGGFGAGARVRIRRMYRAFTKRYLAGDREVDIVGFSRGAAMAVHFANVIHRYDSPRPEDGRHVAWKYYKGLGWTFRHPKLRVRPEAATDAPPSHPIRFLGLWDTVASFGLPIGFFRNRFTRTWWVNRLPDSVARSFHAMALDEVRSTFELVRPTPSRAKGQHYEVWFRGVHSNVGGGYLDRGLSDIALAWMMELYLWTVERVGGTPPVLFQQALRMLEPEPGAPPQWVGNSFETLEADPDGELGLPLAASRDAWRVVPQGALIHHSVYRRTGNLLADHYRSNRRLLRQVPQDARPVFDPPFFYGDTPRLAASRVGQEAFWHVPVRASEWLKVKQDHVFRSDSWVATGQHRNAWTNGTSRESFVAIATEWLLAGKPLTPLTSLPQTLTGPEGEVVPAPQVEAWVVPVLRALEPYVPRLRSFTP